ncbi:MAG: RyR domain-containing protein [Candidatus Coproplasma sp.]
MATLEEACAQFFKSKLNKNESDIDCLHRTLQQFCKSGKKGDAFSVYYCFCEIFEVFGSGYGSMNRLLEFLFDHEYYSGELLSKHRDHYSHSVYVFALGLSIYANDKTFRNAFSDFYKAENADDTSFLYWWGLTALFHDIGYPFQLAHEQMKAYTQSMWGEGNPDSPYISYDNMGMLLTLGKNITCEEQFSDVRTVGELLAYGIHKRLGYPLNILLSLLNERYSRQKQFMDHAYFSAVLLLHQFSKCDVKFTEPLLDVLTAIALHNNLNRYDINGALNQDTAVPVSRHPLAYLLILCDELQDWDRTAFGYVSKKDPLAWKVDISVSDGKIDICYVFDSINTFDTQERDSLQENAEVVSEILRENLNYAKISSGKFLNSVNKLVRGDIELTVRTREEKKQKKTKVTISSENFINLCDFAYAIHKSYRRIYGGVDFDELSLDFRLSNIEQAKSYSDKLELINCFYSDRELDYPVVKRFTKDAEEQNGDARDDMGFLAREEHLRWVREKLQSGWKYGTDYKTKQERDAKKIHKDIIPFDFLPEDEKQKDELMIKNMVPYLYHFGHGVRIYSYRGGRKPVLDIMGCGHHTISTDRELLKEQIKAILKKYSQTYRVIVRTNFALGAELLIAECANEIGITIKAALPLPYEEYIEFLRSEALRYKQDFTEEDEYRIRHLLAQAVSCKVVPDTKNGCLEAAKYTINKSKKLIALWDGVQTVLEDDNHNPVNRGGTWHKMYIARYSRGLKDEDIHVIKCDR